MTKNIIIFILIIISIILLLRPEKIEYKEKIIKGDSIIVEIPEPYEVTKIVEIPSIIDTLAIIENYFSEKKYKQVLPIEDLGDVTVDLELSQNKLNKLSYSYDLQYKQIINKKNAIGISTSFNDYMIKYDREINQRFNLNTSYLIKEQIFLIGISYKF